jgi:hypothetical protein
MSRLLRRVRLRVAGEGYAKTDTISVVSSVTIRLVVIKGAVESDNQY